MSVRNLLDLSGKTAIVTGGSRGIGLQMATALGEMGARVALTARRQDELDEARTGLESAGVECLTIAGDLADDGAIARIVDAALAAWGHIDILVNNAGCNWAAPAEEYPDEGWRKVMRLNVDAQFFLCREVGKRSMLPRRSGKIVNIGSMLSIFGASFGPVYGASKGGIVQLTKSLAVTWAPDNIQVNAVLPGWVDTELTRRGRTEIPGLDQKVLAGTPAGRWGHIDDFAGIAVLLASAASGFSISCRAKAPASRALAFSAASSSRSASLASVCMTS